MNKIYTFILGVVGIVNTIAVQATEKFDVLPDLPDPLAYAVQPAAASTISGTTDAATMLGAQSIGHEPNILSVLLSLIFVILLIYVTGIIYTKLNKVGYKTLKQQGDLAKTQVSVLSTTALGGNKTLHVVELDGKRMLIGASASAIQLIKDLGSITSPQDEDFSHIEIPNIKIPKIEIPKIEIPTINFSKLVTKAHKGLKDIETTISEEKSTQIENNTEVNVTENYEESQNSDEIIESLFTQQNIEEVPPAEENEAVASHVVDPDDFALYKKYLG